MTRGIKCSSNCRTVAVLRKATAKPCGKPPKPAEFQCSSGTEEQVPTSVPPDSCHRTDCSFHNSEVIGQKCRSIVTSAQRSPRVRVWGSELAVQSSGFGEFGFSGSTPACPHPGRPGSADTSGRPSGAEGCACSRYSPSSSVGSD